MPGSEDNWLGYVTPPGGRAGAWRSGVDTTRYIMTDWGPGWDYPDFDFDRDAPRLAEMDSLYAASNPDLRDFEARGGKLIIYHGWNDPAVAPLGSIDYYQAVQRAMGGADSAKRFARLFMVPGMNHCFSGDGAFAVDWISALEAWVERDQPPDRLRAAHLVGNHDSPSMIRRFPFDTALERFTRPLYPWPLKAHVAADRSADDMSGWRPE
jgi:feruloyl esterase